jgi:hypothetical protein
VDFVFTPEDAQSTASVVAAHLESKSYTVTVESAVDQHLAFRPTISATDSALSIYVEAQSSPAYTTGVGDLVSWAHTQRAYCEIYIAAPMDAPLSGRLLERLKRNGVGLILIDDNDTVQIHQDARNPALVVTPDPHLSLGRCATVVREAVKRFNEVDRKGALSTMCEIVEGETEKLVKRLAAKAWIDRTEQQVVAMDFSSQINVSASKDRYTNGRDPLVDGKLKDDLHSFRGARNLLQHKATTKRAERERESQFAERMLMGPRLTADLLSLQRKIK